ncbi:MAG: multidrug ABC transporter ATP-binding protein [Acetobacterium sp. MES1]|uniref:ABC transporter ATP-binding protein n=1 Tax=Acetobacterium sp. MES1 TaxID=1899015 RepID=UPI000B9D0C7B|nr:ABC transporter ATP-binding protein [Acetobacterium sp. MES1]OXS26720.1 MAG: multidrug ABC transporter ATP-binding protein [Acetobacterium sp. MES1]
MNHLITFLKSKKGMLGVIFLVTLMQVFRILLVPFFVAQIINVGIMEKDIDTILWIGLEMLAAAGITALISLWSSYLCADLASLTGKHMRELIFDKTQFLSISEFNQFGTASMITRATGDITIIQQTMIMITQLILPTPLIAVAAVVMTGMVSMELVYIPLAAMVIFMILILVLFKKASPVSRTIQARVDRVNRIVRESVVGVRVIRAFDNTSYEQKRSDDTFVAYADNVIHLNRIFAMFNPMVWAIMGITMVAVVWFGGYLVLQATTQIGSIMAVMQYTVIILMFLMMSAMVIVMVPRMIACLERISEVLDTAPEIADDREAVASPSVKGSKLIVFNDVSFSYQGAEEPVLRNLSFCCEAGKTTAIIGGTGSGKSTIAALMLRLYDIQEGQILVAGNDIRRMTQHDLRESISYVPQKAFLFSGTIAENLRTGKPDATDADLRQAVKIAQAEAFITTLEAGYQSPVAQGGSNFSGGQKQRLCIARALVKKAPIYIFDDSFSALDYQTDAALRSELKLAMKDACLIVVAQRISSIMDADQIIVLDNGSIAGIGRHEELLRDCSLYREIADSQVKREG